MLKRKIKAQLCKLRNILIDKKLSLFSQLLEGEVRRPLLFSQPEQTDSISLTQSEPYVFFEIVSIYISIVYIRTKYCNAFIIFVH